MKAFVKTDPREDPVILDGLKSRLQEQGIQLFYTSRRWQDLPNKPPFIYLRNPYMRFNTELLVADFHIKNPSFVHIECAEGELLSVNPCPGAEFPYVARDAAYFQEPNYSPLPIMLVTHRRPSYLRLALNSIFYNCKDIKGQKLYLVASDPDAETERIIRRCVANNQTVEAVITRTNLGYSISNFGSKFFSLKKFIHFEDDGILPESLSYQIPYWTQQLNYRSTTADFVGFRVSEQNKKTCILKTEQAQNVKYTYLDYPDTWNYFTPEKDHLPAVSGLGLVIDSEKMYVKHDKKHMFQTDLGLYRSSKTACILNIPVYHIGANQNMDLHPSSEPPKKVDKIQKGYNIRTEETKEIDLEVDWTAYATA